MEKIELEFSAIPSLFPGNDIAVILTLDEKGKKYKVKKEDFMGKYGMGLSENKKELPPLPKRVLNAFTENVIDKILSKEEIPNESGMIVLDGYSYEITITKGDVTKEYDADDASIKTYPLLRYLASWYKKALY